MSNIRMGKSGEPRVATVAAARALMWQDVADGLIERPDVAINQALAKGAQVAVKRPLPNLGLAPGDGGTVVQVYPGGGACEVEFFSAAGATVGVFTVDSCDLLLSNKDKNEL